MQTGLENISVAGMIVTLAELQRKELKGAIVDDIARFKFYRAAMAGNEFALLVSNVGANETPANCAKISTRLSSGLSLPIAFYFPTLKFYERQRFIEKQVFFITGRGDAFLPNMILSSKASKKKEASKLSAAAQFLLLYHLQHSGLDGLSISEIADMIPQYSYVSIAKAVENLEALGLCECIKDMERSKRLKFNAEGLVLWEKAKPFMASPVKAVKYCDAVPAAGFQYSGISALASYTMISPDENPTVAVYSGEFKDGNFQGLNDFDGNVKIEIWRYPAMDIESDTVDRLSLFLSLEDTEDPRVEKENKSMFDKIWQKM
ncbi:MAG: MarR family transcriptional regulator [Bacteroidales bacterium]|nr:MarR family transcriptional regulator [Bacteroidales bacterium]